MNKTYVIKKYALDKVALLVLLIITLLAAHFVVISKSSLKLSGPIVLEHTGLSASVPTGNGWQTDKRWKYEENGYTLNSVFVPNSTNPTAFVHCRYLVAPMKSTMLTRFEQKAAASGGTIEKTAQIHTADLTIDWAHIKKNEALLETFLGSTWLPYGRRLDIEVHHIGGDTASAKEAFKSIASSLRFEDTSLLRTGSKVITEIKHTGLSAFFYGQERQNFFLIKDAENRPLGFTLDTFVEPNPSTPLNIQLRNFFYIRGRHEHPAMPRRSPQQRVVFFRSTDHLDEFTWKSETSTVSNKIATEIKVDEDGIISVKKFSREADEKRYYLSSTAIPEVLLDQLVVQMLRGSSEKIIVDVIGADGTITPALVCRTGTENGTHVLNLQLLDNQGFSEQIYVDSQQRILKVLLQQKSTYTLERTDAEDILRQFPERAEYILQESKMLEQNRL